MQLRLCKIAHIKNLILSEVNILNKYQNNKRFKLEIILNSLGLTLVVAFAIIWSEAPTIVKVCGFIGIVYLIYKNINTLTQSVLITNEKITKSSVTQKKEICWKDVEDIIFKFAPIKNSSKIDDLVTVVLTKKGSNEKIGFTYKMDDYIKLTYVVIQKCEQYKRFDKLKEHLNTYYKEII